MLRALAGVGNNAVDTEKAHTMRRAFIAACAGVAVVVPVSRQLHHVTNMAAENVVIVHQQMERPIRFGEPEAVRVTGQAPYNHAFAGWNAYWS